MSLGEKLRNSIDMMESMRIAKEARVNAEKLEKELARKELTRAKFNEYKVAITHTIEAGLVFKPVKMPSIWGYTAISDAKHPDNHLWLEFFNWARSEALDVKCVFDHDGCGRESWFMLVVNPL